MDIRRPIFLVGFPRSGTTFLQSLIATQPGVVSFPETHFYTVLTGHLESGNCFGEEDIADILERASRMLEFSFTPEMIASLNLIQGSDGTWQRKDVFEWILTLLCSRQNIPEISAGDIMLEKTPSHAVQVETILADYPDMRVVHITRHPVDALRSHWTKLSHGERPLSDLIQDWHRVRDKSLEFARAYPSQYYRVTYEDLRDDMMGQMSALLDFLNIPFDRDRIHHYPHVAQQYIMSFETWKADNTKSGSPTSTSTTDWSWKQTATVQLLLQDEMQNDGYSVYKPIVQQLYNLKNRGNLR